ncbi:class C sortase [Anaerococcus provencensis]|uniref:class C sortase n=1 Tax=Anaerococcus provencensis TaxID=938293 RepID=UPI0003131FA5|nr:class C sortase [Anaerococcus provencensis]
MNKKLKLTKTNTLGYILILVGLLFVTVPLIRRSYKDYSARMAEKEFRQIQENRKAEDVVEETKNAEEYNEIVRNSDITVVDPFTAEDYKTSYEKFQNTNIPFAYLVIPKLDKRLPLYLDATLDHISRGVAQVDGTSIPVGGPGTRSVIAGHRGWWGDTMFLYLDQLNYGDYVYLERAEQTMRYVVSDKEVIDPYDWNKLAPRGDADIISLMTCSPFLPPRPNRLLVNCVRDETTKTIAEEFKLPGTDDYPVSQKDEEENKVSSTDKTVAMTRIATLILAIIGTLLFILILIRFIRRLKNTISNR